MIINIGFILYKSNLAVLLKNIDNIVNKSLLENRQIHYNIVFLDNNKGFQLKELQNVLKQYFFDSYSTFHFLSSENIDTGSGHNKIFKYFEDRGGFDYYLCLNPSGIAHYKMIENLCDFAKSKNNKGVFEALQFPVEHPKQYDPHTFETEWCADHCALYPYQIFKELNGFDDIFLNYMEDVDLSWRARIAGYKCYSVNTAYYSLPLNSDSNMLPFFTKHNAISGCKLAAKYGNTAAKKEYLSTLKKENMLNKKELQALKNRLKSIKPISSAVADFSHGEYFSVVRW